MSIPFGSSLGCGTKIVPLLLFFSSRRPCCSSRAAAATSSKSSSVAVPGTCCKCLSPRMKSPMAGERAQRCVFVKTHSGLQDLFQCCEQERRCCVGKSNSLRVGPLVVGAEGIDIPGLGGFASHKPHHTERARAALVHDILQNIT